MEPEAADRARGQIKLKVAAFLHSRRLKGSPMRFRNALVFGFAGMFFAAAWTCAQTPSPEPGAGAMQMSPPAGHEGQLPRVTLNRKGATIVLDAYAPNIVRVTLSLKPDAAQAAPGFGIVAEPSRKGWKYSTTALADIYQSDRIVATIARPQSGSKPPVQTQVDISKYFNGSTPGAHITFATPEGKKLLELTGWSAGRTQSKGRHGQILHDRRPDDPEFYTVGATFASPDDEHYYGLGDNHEGFLDHRGHPVRCWNDYLATAAPSTCVPFLMTNKGYGLIWDNPSKTTIEPGFNEQTKWKSQVGDRVSFFVIAGNTADEIYAGYRLVTGPTPLLPKAAYGYIQCKQRYASQDEVLSVAKAIAIVIFPPT